MSSSKKKQKNPKVKGNFLDTWDSNLSEFHEKLRPMGANNRLSYLNVKGPRNADRTGQTTKVCTKGNLMADYPGNLPSTSGTSCKKGQVVNLGSFKGPGSDNNKKLSFSLKQKSSLVVNTNALDTNPSRGMAEKSGNKCDNLREVAKKRKSKNKRSKSNSLRTLHTDVNPISRVSASADCLQINSNSVEEKFSPSLDELRHSTSERRNTIEVRYNPFGSGEVRSSSEIMKALSGLNPAKHFSGKVNVSCPPLRRSDITGGSSSLPSEKKKTFNSYHNKRVPVNITPDIFKKDLSQASLISRYDRAHPNKVRNLKEEILKTPSRSVLRFVNDRTPSGQRWDSSRKSNPYSHSYITKKSVSKVGPSAVEQTSRATHGVFGTKPLSSSTLNPPPVIHFKSSSPCSVPGSSSGTGGHKVDLLPGQGDHQEDALMEWEDIEDEKVLQDIKVHRQCHQYFGNIDQLIEDMDTNCLDVSEDNTEDCLIVLDTNILIAHLKFVEELSKRDYKGIGCPILVVPWMVLKELDALKGGPRESRVYNNKMHSKARAAVHFINSSFSSHHPRIKGQSALDDKEHCIAIDVPDDSILNCCLQLYKKGKRVILLSNDVNFCNKAMATGILSYGKEQLNRAMTHGKLEFAADESKNLLHGPSPSQTEDEKRHDQTVLKFKIVFQDFLSKFIETEMKRVYKDMWTKVIFIKQPWSLLDSLKNVSKHWIAVFGFVMNKSGQKVIENLISEFNTEQSFTGSPPVEVENMVKLAGELCDTIVSDNYQAMALDYKTSFTSLLKVLKECKMGEASESQAQPKNSFPAPQLPAIQCDAGIVFETFQFMWTLVNNFCGVVCDTFGISHGISYEKPENFPSLEEVKGKLPDASHYVSTIVICMTSILETPETHLSVEHPAILNLHTIIQSMVSSEFLAGKDITCEKLLLFCMDNSTRVMLRNGLTQFQEAQMLISKMLNSIG